MTNLLPATTNPLAGYPVMKMLDVAMSTIVGDYDDADLVSEWQWVKRMASHEHVGVKDDSAYEYMLNLALELDAIPPARPGSDQQPQPPSPTHPQTAYRASPHRLALGITGVTKHDPSYHWT
ncbi:hypothetical protein [Aeromonas hydrophila]|uniref:hypothetical protein n=1 Tax=Aeromonas hydrophila TaxID=644 RepID=UPI001F24B0FE|nr:hypothetical protein [Aeromonas hydrophila]